MKALILGADGRLGGGLVKTAEPRAPIQVTRRQLAELRESIKRGSFDKFLLSHPDEQILVLIAIGNTDPSAPVQDLLEANFEVPKMIADATTRMNVRIVTFGTVLEVLSETDNEYVSIKRAWADFVAEQVCLGRNMLHLRLNTLYGAGQPHDHMFLGQILRSIRANEVFEMSSGRQFREYHHVEDDARAIWRLAAGDIRGLESLSHGQPVQLASLATRIFDSLGKSSLLRIGAIPDPEVDIFTDIFQSNGNLDGVYFRDTGEGVTRYLLDLSEVGTGKND